MSDSPFEIRVLASAASELKRLDRSVCEQLLARLDWLAEHADVVRHVALAGPLRGLCRLRSGDYRAIYEVLPEERAIIVHAVGHRREVYRRS